MRGRRALSGVSVGSSSCVESRDAADVRPLALVAVDARAERPVVRAGM